MPRYRFFLKFTFFLFIILSYFAGLTTKCLRLVPCRNSHNFESREGIYQFANEVRVQKLYDFDI